MIVVIATNENNLDAEVALHFGRCGWYCLYFKESQTTEFIENIDRDKEEKAGTAAAEFLLGKNISMVVAGRFGSKVVNIFRNNKVQMVIPETSKNIKEIINQINI